MSLMTLLSAYPDMFSCVFQLLKEFSFMNRSMWFFNDNDNNNDDDDDDKK